MATDLKFKDFYNQPMWRPEAPILAATTTGVGLAWDNRNNADNYPYMYLLRSSSALDVNDPITGDWMTLNSPGLAGTFGAGTSVIFNPSSGPKSRALAGSTTTKINLDALGNLSSVPNATWSRATTVATVTTPTAHNFQTGQVLHITASSDVAAIVLTNIGVTITVLTATTFTFACLNAGAASGTLTIGIAVGNNQLANRGDGRGRRIRVTGYASGKVEERRVIANTGGVSPAIELDTALTFTPAVGDLVEFLSGRVFMLNSGTVAAGMFKYYDIATNSFSGNLATTNLPTIGADSQLVAISELYIPHNRTPSSGFVNGGATADTKNCIQATASGATSITGSGMSALLLANQYRNFQVRIVEDTVTPTSVGQRRRIASHTAGANGVFTTAAWAVTPSTSAKFVVENDDDKILLFTNQTAVYNYNQTANTWDTTTWAAAPVAGAAGIVCEQSYGIEIDTDAIARHSHIYRIRGGGNFIDVFDIAGAATGSWTADIVYGNKAQTFTTGTCGAYDPVTFSGRFLHLNLNATQRFARFDLKNRILEPETYLRTVQSTAVVGQRMAMNYFIDGAVKTGIVYQINSSLTIPFSLFVIK